jgi:predicted ATPase
MAAGITRITVEGYKSIVKEQSIDIAPLTILAGANSSGKSSMIQPLLLLKQTLEAPYDPGPLLINGPTLKFTSSDQFMSGKAGKARALRISIDADDGKHWSVKFVKERGKPLAVAEGGELDVPSWYAAGSFQHFSPIRYEILTMIHVRGLRGNPERSYPFTAVGESFPGVFENYVASIINRWRDNESHDDLALNQDLKHLELGGGVFPSPLNEAELELMVLQGTEHGNYFNIADVGFGVSQALPILVGLRIAETGQMVYVEQPELHLHPRAQTRMADVLANAAKRGVRVVIETHSSLLLRAVQTLIAKRQIDRNLVRLHWFARDKRGVTHVKSAQMDENGAFGNWPEDFGDVILDSERAYLDAVEFASTDK